MMVDLSQVQPGDRFTDPDGGTWVMLLRGLLAADGPYWSYVSPTGHWSQRKQEEAEAAGMVPLVADDPDAQLACGIGLCMEPARGRDAEGFSVCVDHLPAAPAPLDPGNPEHLRAHAAASYRLAELLPGTQDGETLETAAGIAEWRADRLDREHAEAEQDAADRKRAEAFIRERFPAHVDAGGAALICEWIRAERERAERQEAEKAGYVCCCGAMRVPAGELSVIDAGTAHRHGGPCYVVDTERQEAEK